MIEGEGHLATSGVALEELLEGRVRLAPASQRGKRLTELLVRERQLRLEPDRLLEAGHSFFEALLQREHAAQVLVQVRKVRLQRDGLAHDLLRFREAPLFAERIAE